MKIEAIRNYEIERSTLKVDDDDCECIELDAGEYSSLLLFMDSIGLSELLTKLLPYWRDSFPDFDALENEHISWINKLPEPQWCLSEVHRQQILIAAESSAAALDLLEDLIILWADGYSLYLVHY